MQVATKYAKMLFDKASEAKVVNETFDEISTLCSAIFLKAEISIAIDSPVKKDKIEELLAKVSLKYKFSKLVTNFIQLVVKLKRLKFLPDIVSEYKKMVDSLSGCKIIDLVSARELGTLDKNSLNKLLLSQFGSNILVKYAVDSALIGGVIASYGSQVLDASLKGAIDKVLVT